MNLPSSKAKRFGPTLAGTVMLGIAASFPLPSKAATLIDFTFEGTGTGSLGGNQFVDSQFAIIVTADTSTAATISAELRQILVGVAYVEIDGFSTATFQVALRLFSAPLYSAPPGSPGDAVVGLSLASGPDLLNLFESEFVGYDLISNLGPVFEPVPDYQSRLSFNNVLTDMGGMTLTSSRDVTFTAQVVPEPSTFLITTIGMSACAGFMGRRRRV